MTAVLKIDPPLPPVSVSSVSALKVPSPVHGLGLGWGFAPTLSSMGVIAFIETLRFKCLSSSPSVSLWFNGLRLWTSISFIIICLLAGCGLLNPASEPGSSVAPILQGQRSPQDVATGFLDNWKLGDYQAMYAALSPQSQSQYTFPVFQKTYEDAMTSIEASEIRYTVQQAQPQGASFALTYDLEFVSPVYGTISDSGRVMRLVQNAGNWGLAWSSMDIVNGLAAGSQVVVRGRRQPRGNIYDRNGKLLVEEGGTMIALFSARQDMVTEEDCLDVLARVLKTRRYDLEQTFAIQNIETLFYLGEIDEDIDAVEGANLDQICAVQRYPRQTRRYVGVNAAAHVLGFVAYITSEQLTALKNEGYKEGDLVGQLGIEQLYEKELAGKSEQILQVISPSNVVLRELAGRQGENAQSVSLTLDRDLQLAAAQAMADAYTYAGGNWGNPAHSTGAGVVVLDVKTGAVRALVSWPLFDPHVFNGTDSPNAEEIGIIAQDVRQPLRNRVVQEQYFPGSTFKIITTAAAASEGVMTEPTFDCQLEWKGQQYGDTIPVRTDWRVLELPDSRFANPAGQVTMAQALTTSCNPFFYEMGARLFTQRGPATLTGYARQMGLGALTGIDLAGEAFGSLPNPTSVEQGINEAIGQGGIQVSIIQMARMVAGLANGGTLYTPYVVQQVGGVAGQPVSFQAVPKVAGEMGLSEEALATLYEGMCGVVTNTELGTASFVFTDAPYTVCGKTGTAQSGRVEPYGWFVAYAPADDPQIAIAGMVEYSREGSETAAPIIRRILDTYFGAAPAPFPDWWFDNQYVALEIPEGTTGG
jgi:penicillin-binding protein 2